MSAIAHHLRTLRNAAAPAYQPPYADQIEDADPQSISHAVVGLPVAPRSIDHVHIADLVAVAAHQRRQESVQPVEIRQRQKYLAPERLQSATGVARAVPKDRGAHAVGDPRLE